MAEGASTVTPDIPEVPLSAFVERLVARATRVPLEGIIETTFRCNLSCAHCYVNQPAGSAEERAREVPLPRLLALVDEIADAGGLSLLLTGGEVLCREDFPRLYLHARARGLLVTVFTNGTLVTERLADLLAEHPPYRIEVSVYGATRETYERVTGVPGSFDRCLAGIRRLHARGLPLQLKTMVLTLNRHELPAMRRLAEDLGVPFRYDTLLNARVDCGVKPLDALQLSPAEALSADREDPRRWQGLSLQARGLESSWAAGEAPAPGPSVYGCGAGRLGYNVDPYGRLQLCQLSRRGGYDLRGGTFAEGWGDALPRLRERPWQGNSVCRGCDLREACGTCAGAAELETGDPEGLVAQFCAITHARLHAILGHANGHAEDASCCLARARSAAAPPLIRLEVRKRPATA